MATVTRALISVSDKRGVVDLARGLAALGIEILSTGGTAKALTDAGLAVTPVEDFTGFPEMLDGRVKTLHPRIHAGILHRRSDPGHLAAMTQHDLKAIDLVVVNLYPFEQTVAKPDCGFADAIENIDIGGPSLLRASAKNHADVGVVVDPDDYPVVLAALTADGALSAEHKLALAKKAFRLTARYDGAIADYLGSLDGGERRPFGETLHLQYTKAQDLRYGENPHQSAAFYRSPVVREACIATAKQLQGKELSYNNIVDANAAFALLQEFDEIAAVAIKHTNPCGVATSMESLADAFRKTRACDPVSIFGGIVGLNREVDAATAQEILNLYQQGFLEIVLAPGYAAPGPGDAGLVQAPPEHPFAGNPGDRRCTTGPLRGQADCRRPVVSGTRYRSGRGARLRGGDQASADRRGVPGPGLCLAGVQTRQVQRHRAHLERSGRGCGCRSDEPG